MHAYLGTVDGGGESRVFHGPQTNSQGLLILFPLPGWAHLPQVLRAVSGALENSIVRPLPDLHAGTFHTLTIQTGGSAIQLGAGQGSKSALLSSTHSAYTFSGRDRKSLGAALADVDQSGHHSGPIAEQMKFKRVLV